ncbi:hypothetical protein VNO78_07664 [Psophocarpus tetragonolobus]|uniref:Uncharacterized protein n=1 Tax=Psophocarpus tetragonolobus TaxID=3891 RepID=A0AAN9STN0_PSOTE
MGNCMERYHADGEEQEEGRGRLKGFRKIDDEKGVSMKIVVTKEELKWLILQLNEKGGMRVEQMVEEIQKSREQKVEGWKPSLESILEAPEMLEMDAIS